ncbi:hypothetical protein DNTS_027284 [Danionella cerebrum]|uniref:Transmembrane protein 177 n=1 Tax=Danionella cerebrum TaxID=2873325 RepID=A0A553R4J6_9TELE|nr:hypothetical protein DNTS_027284 [Danionella translucida]
MPLTKNPKERAEMAFRLTKLLAFIQRNRTPLLLTGCGAVFFAKTFYHVFPGHTYRKVYQAWHKGEPASLSEKLENIFQDVLKDCSIKSPEKFSAFAAYGFHPVGAGVPWLPAGAQIGIPSNFNSSTDDPSGITDRTIFVNGKELEWESDSGVTLRNSLVLSPEAQKFVIARELNRLGSGEPILKAAVGPVCLIVACVFNVAVKQIYLLQSRLVLFRGAVNIVTVVFGVFAYIFASDGLNHWVDYHSDRRAARLSSDYAKGGLEFYEKILTQNKTLRVLMGQEGEALYAHSGNLFPGYMWKLSHAPFTSRRDKILNILKNEKV